MAALALAPGVTIDGFTLEARLHQGGMASLWSVTKPGETRPMLMKVPYAGEGQDPAAIVSFEMEQMILPRLSGPHVPQFIASGDFSRQPYLVMERIEGTTLLEKIENLPLGYSDVAALGSRIAAALQDLHRQNVIHLDVKPSNIMLRPGGEAVLIDFGLSHHRQLPDLMQEEFRLPYGTAPYMAPEQLLGVRKDARSDQFALGALLYFFSTGERPFGEGETMWAMRRRLWRDPYPPRSLRADYPPWLQEIVLRCLEREPEWRYPEMSHLAFDLTHPDQVKLTARSQKLKRDPFSVVLRRRFNPELKRSIVRDTAVTLPNAPIIMAAIDSGGASEINEAVRVHAGRLMAASPDARLACVNVLKQNLIALDTSLDEAGNNKRIERMVMLQSWAAPLELGAPRLTVHVLAAIDPASALLEFARINHVDHIVIGARQSSFMRNLLGSVSAKVAAEAACSVTVVRPKKAPLLTRALTPVPPES